MNITISAAVAVFLVGTVIPMLTAVVAKRYTSSKFKDAVTIALSVVSGVLTPYVLTGGSFDFWTTVVAALFTYTTAVGVHYRILKPKGVTGTDGVIAQALPGGVGNEY